MDVYDLTDDEVKAHTHWTGETRLRDELAARALRRRRTEWERLHSLPAPVAEVLAGVGVPEHGGEAG